MKKQLNKTTYRNTAQKKLPKSEVLEKLKLIASSNFATEFRYVCPQSTGLFEDEKNCRAYWQCNQGKGTKNTCQAGLAWNKKTSTCDWENNVDCNQLKI